MDSSKKTMAKHQEERATSEQSLADILFMIGKSRGGEDADDLLDMLDGIEDDESKELLKEFAKPKTRLDRKSCKWLGKLSFDEVDLAIISHLWCLHLEGSHRNDVLHVLNRISDNPVIAYQRLDKMRILLHLGYIVEDSRGKFYNPFLTELHAEYDHELLNMEISLSPAMLEFITGKATMVTDYAHTPFVDDEEHLQTWLCLLDAARELYKQSAGAAVFKKKWILESQPFVRNMLECLRAKEACTTIPLRFRAFCAKYKLSDAEILLFVMLINQDINGEEDMFNKPFRESYEDYIVMHKSTLETLKKSSLFKHDLIHFPEGSVDKYDMDEAGSIVISPLVKEDLFGIKKKVRKQVTRTDDDILKAVCGRNGLYEIMKPVRTFDDIILPDKQIESLKRVVSFKQDSTMNKLARWGVEGYSIPKKRRGYLLLLCGTPGTGKTLAAEVIAAEMGKTIIKTDSAHIVDKFFGETERNAALLFEQFNRLCDTMQNSPVLLFNEADQLLNRRTLSDRSTDKAWNALTSILLEAFENPRGIIIATTNLKDCLDEAYSRRFDLTLELTSPGEAERQRMWDVLLPKKIPGRDALDLSQLAKHNLKGGQIVKIVRNVGLYLACGTAKHKKLTTELVTEFCLQEINQSFETGSSSRKSIGFLNKSEVK